MDLLKQTPFYEAVLRTKVAQICDSLGFHAITQDSSNILVSLYQRTFYHLARHCKDSANNNSRTEPTIIDLRQACDFVGISIPELQEYVETVRLPFPFQILEDDEQKPSNRIQRNLHIDDLLEAEKNSQRDDQGDNENKALSEDEEEKPSVPLLKDTFADIASKFTNFNPVTADKKIRLGGRIVLLPGTKLKISPPIPPKEDIKPIVAPEQPVKSSVEKPRATPKVAKERKPLDPSAAEPPSFFPILETNIKLEEPEPEDDKLVIPPAVVPIAPILKPQKGKKKKKSTLISTEPKDEILTMPPPPLPTSPILKPQKGKKRKKKPSDDVPVIEGDKLITPPPPISTSPALEQPKLKKRKKKPIEDLPVVEEEKLIITPPPISTTPVPKLQKGKKKKKKSSDGQFAIVTETVTQAEEKEWFCPACGGPDDGDLMVQCDSCQEWYHLGCTDLKKPPEENENWECDVCINKSRALQKRPPSSMEVVKTITPEPSIVAPIPAPVPETIQPPPAPMPGTSKDDLCPECNLPDNGTLMIQCDDPFCAKWFHGKCVSLLEAPKEDESWFCKVCVEKQQSAFKRRRRAK